MILLKTTCSKIQIIRHLLKRLQTTNVGLPNKLQPSLSPSFMNFQNIWPDKEKAEILNDMIVVEDFLTEHEEMELIKEVDPYMTKLRYEFDHWDNAIHGFRETERKHWYPDNKQIIERVGKIAFSGEIMPYIHVLDLAEDGVIKPHVDSSRYCGSIISGLSLLSDCVMRLVRTDAKEQCETNAENKIKKDHPFYVDVLLRRRSLYIMRDTARYNFTHEILGNKESMFKEKAIPKSRRISIICRNKP